MERWSGGAVELIDCRGAVILSASGMKGRIVSSFAFTFKGTRLIIRFI